MPASRVKSKKHKVSSFVNLEPKKQTGEFANLVNQNRLRNKQTNKQTNVRWAQQVRHLSHMLH
jgi:hypothetical protein